MESRSGGTLGGAHSGQVDLALAIDAHPDRATRLRLIRALYGAGVFLLVTAAAAAARADRATPEQIQIVTHPPLVGR